MKIKIGENEVSMAKDDYDALKKISEINIFQMASNQFGYLKQLHLIKLGKKFREKCEKLGIDPKPVSPKFLMRFVDAASFDDDEYIQNIWADILAKEASKPGSISLRTISSLKNLSKEEAVAFQSLHKYALRFNDKIAIYNERRENKSSIDDVLNLVDCGLLVSESTNISLNVSIEPQSTAIISRSLDNAYVVVAQNDTDEKQLCTVPIFSLTQAGRDIIEATCSDDKASYYDVIAKGIKKSNPSISLKLHKVKHYDKKTDQITYETNDLFE